jgi:hypothetical protein
LLKNAHLAVSAILLAARVNAKPPEFACNNAKAEGGNNRQGKNKNNALKESGHTHHRGGLQEAADRLSLDAIIS